MEHKNTRPKEEDADLLFPGTDPGKANPFRVPEGYFDSLAGNISGLISTKEKRTSGNLIRLHARTWLPTLAAAMLVIGVMIIALTGQRNARQVSGELTADPSGAALAYDYSYAGDVETSDHMGLDAALETMEIIPVSELLLGDTLIVDEDIIEYLSGQDLDTDLLAELQPY